MADETPRRRELLVSKTWVQASVVVFLIGFFVLGLLAYRTYTPPTRRFPTGSSIPPVKSFSPARTSAWDRRSSSTTG